MCANAFRASSNRNSHDGRPAARARQAHADSPPDRRRPAHPEILRGRAHHARPADVDLLHERVERDVGLRRRLHKRIQVDDDDVDGGDVVLPRVAMSSARPRRARMPPWTAGCSVFTRPSMISGKPVTAEMPVTGTPASRARARCRLSTRARSPGRPGLCETHQTGFVGNAEKGSRH